jgi:hypothetical protein
MLKLNQEKVATLLAMHSPTNNSVSGFLTECVCGEIVDDYSIHQSLVLESAFRSEFGLDLEDERSVLYDDMVNVLKRHYNMRNDKCSCGFESSNIVEHQAEHVFRLIKVAANVIS